MKLSHAKDFASRNGWMSRIDPGHRKFLLDHARLVTRPAGELVSPKGVPALGLWGLVQGTMVLCMPREDDELVPVLSVGAGFWIGDLSAFSGQPHMISMEARHDCTLLNVPAQHIRQLARDQPDSLTAFYMLNHQNQGLSLRLMAAHTAASSNQKIALHLSIIADYTDTGEGWLSLTNQDLALQCGVSLATVRRSLKKLEDCGIVRSRYARIDIPNRDALITFAKESQP